MAEADGLVGGDMPGCRESSGPGQVVKDAVSARPALSGSLISRPNGYGSFHRGAYAIRMACGSMIGAADGGGV